MTSVSVIMPARNAAHTIEAALRSVLAQSEAGEIIVVDDHSSDGTTDLARRVGGDRVRVAAAPRRGIAAALNHGFDLASGDFIARCDADDLYPEGRLGRQLAFLRQHDGFIAVSGGYRTISERGKPVADIGCDGAGRNITGQLLRGEPISHFCTWLTRKPAIERVGGARDWFKTAEDQDLQYRLASEGAVWHEPTIAYLYRLHDGSVTHIQSDRLRVFYGETASRFALQRAAGGPDDLEAGRAPEEPAVDEAGPMSASDHIVSQLESSAWRDHGAGRKLQALQKIARAIRYRPGKLGLWKQMAAAVLKRPSVRRLDGRQADRYIAERKDQAKGRGRRPDEE